MSFLSNILEATRQAIDAREQALPLEKLKGATKPLPDDHRFRDALQPDRVGGQRNHVAVIAEFKRSAPSSELKHADASVRKYVQEYVEGGAAALSILTEAKWFEGSLDDLREAREAVSLPILRKDFVISERQIYEAAHAGADAILLIAAVLCDDEALSDHYGLARNLGLDVLVEVRNAEELRRAIELEADLIGINNRNLETLHVDVETTRRLVAEVPSGVTIVSESGLKTRAELDELIELGVHATLIGSALMDAPNRVAKCLELTGKGADAMGSASVDHPAFA